MAIELNIRASEAIIFQREYWELEGLHNLNQIHQEIKDGTSLRKTSQRLSPIIKRNHVSIWNWIQKYKPQKIIQKKKKVMEFIIDETLLKVSNEYVWLWVAIEPIDRIILGIRISVERSMLVAERFIHELSTTYGKQSVSTDGVPGILRLVNS